MIDNWRCPNCGSLNPPRRSKCRSCGSINIQFESEGSGPKDDALDVQPTVEATRGSRAEVEANNVLSPKEEELSEPLVYERNHIDCPSCGKQIPADSAFCLHCGKSLTPSTITQSAGWEYDDFVITYFNKKNKKAYKQAWGMVWSTAAIASQYWQSWQADILPEIQKMLDKGWSPISEIGPSGFKLKEAPNVAGIILLGSQRNVTVVEFRVRMRRRKDK